MLALARSQSLAQTTKNKPPKPEQPLRASESFERRVPARIFHAPHEMLTGRSADLQSASQSRCRGKPIENRRSESESVKYAG